MTSSFPDRTPLYRAELLRRVETVPLEPGALPLMERAGLAAAEVARGLVPADGRPILVLAGPGNNGGDAFVVARHLKRWWFDVVCVFGGSEDKLPADARAAFAAWRAAGGSVVDAIPQRDWGLVIDGLFGIGLQRPVAGRYAEWIAAVNAMPVKRLALDAPSGIDGDTGAVHGTAFMADHTVTFIALKPGLLTLDGPDYAGEITVADLQLDAPSLAPSPGYATGADVLHGLLPPRRHNSHKGTAGSVGIIGGAPGMLGAAWLAGRAALKSGAGRVYVGLLHAELAAGDPIQPELMVRAAADVLALRHLTALAIGPGLGTTGQASKLLLEALASALPLVIDADALNLLATVENAKNVLKQRLAATLLTPHPAEAARLLGCDTAAVQADRIGAALRLAQSFGCGTVLKGNGSVCAWPDGTWSINLSGNPGMATAGMGDVLTGLAAGLLAQGVSAHEALRGAVYLHGAAADRCVAQGAGPLGLTASEVIDAARALLNAPPRLVTGP